MFTKIGDVLRGIILNPVLTATARGAAEAIAFILLYSAADYVTANGLPDELGQFTPFVVLGIRMLEGVIDKIDLAQQRQRDVLREHAPADTAKG